MGRGAFIVFEGCDRVGKSTQVKMLVEALTERNISTMQFAFPDRTTNVGHLLDKFLAKKIEFPSETAHLLFSANRWERKDEILRILKTGTTLIVDRYAASGAAYTSATTGKCLSWCKECDRGLPAPDQVILLRMSAEAQLLRAGWGNERFEKLDIQQKVIANYEKLMDRSWTSIDANQDKDTVHNQLLENALSVIEEVKHAPISGLYDLQGKNDSSL